MDNPIIVAMDGFSKPGDFDRAKAIARKLRPHVWGFKVNDFFLQYGWDGFEGILGDNGETKIMLDQKYYDIPNTVKNYCEVLAEMASLVRIVTVHAHGGAAMMKAASGVLPGRIAAVTVLTSFDADSYRQTLGVIAPISNAVNHLAGLALNSGCEYVVCSGNELETLEHVEIKKIVPGIRPSWHLKADDQKRTMTPRQAMDAGAKYLVIGRPILEADSPEDAAKRTLDEVMSGK